MQCCRGQEDRGLGDADLSVGSLEYLTYTHGLFLVHIQLNSNFTSSSLSYKLYVAMHTTLLFIITVTKSFSYTDYLSKFRYI